MGWLSALVLGPLVVGLLLTAIGHLTRGMSFGGRSAGQIVVAVSLLTAVVELVLITGLGLGRLGQTIDFSQITSNEYVFTESTQWMTSVGINWSLGVDGLSYPMIWLTALLIPISMVMSLGEKNRGAFFPLLLLMESFLLGVFLALDLFMFYIFWELTLIPMFFLILCWGGENRRYAAQKFFIYTFTASVLMLLAILALYFLQPDPSGDDTLTGGRTFDLVAITQGAQSHGASGIIYLGMGMQTLLFVLFLVGFLVKMPSVPVHTWLPDAHVQAPTGGSMLLAGAMLKMGAYGLIRIPVTLFPDALVALQWLLVVVGLVSLVHGAFISLAQVDLKRMVAYSSVSHMGMVLLGVASLNPLGIAGAVFMMFAHGLISPMLFAVAGSFKHHFHSMDIGAMRGMAHHAPLLGTYMMFAWMASLGLPLLAGFVAELAILWAFWQAFGWLVILPALTLIITAAYYLWSIQRTMFEGDGVAGLPATLDVAPPDISRSEHLGFALMAVPIVVFGILPVLMFGMMSDYAAGVFEGGLLSALDRRG